MQQMQQQMQQVKLPVLANGETLMLLPAIDGGYPSKNVFDLPTDKRLLIQRMHVKSHPFLRHAIVAADYAMVMRFLTTEQLFGVGAAASANSAACEKQKASSAASVVPPADVAASTIKTRQQQQQQQQNAMDAMRHCTISDTIDHHTATHGPHGERIRFTSADALIAHMREMDTRNKLMVPEPTDEDRAELWRSLAKKTPVEIETMMQQMHVDKERQKQQWLAGMRRHNITDPVEMQRILDLADPRAIYEAIMKHRLADKDNVADDVHDPTDKVDADDDDDDDETMVPHVTDDRDRTVSKPNAIEDAPAASDAGTADSGGASSTEAVTYRSFSDAMSSISDVWKLWNNCTDLPPLSTGEPLWLSLNKYADVSDASPATNPTADHATDVAADDTNEGATVAASAINKEASTLNCRRIARLATPSAQSDDSIAFRSDFNRPISDPLLRGLKRIYGIGVHDWVGQHVQCADGPLFQCTCTLCGRTCIDVGDGSNEQFRKQLALADCSGSK